MNVEIFYHILSTKKALSDWVSALQTLPLCFMLHIVLIENAGLPCHTVCHIVSRICQSDMVKCQRWCECVSEREFYSCVESLVMRRVRSHASVSNLFSFPTPTHTAVSQLWPFWSNFLNLCLNFHLHKLTLFPFLLHVLVFHFCRLKINCKPRGESIRCPFHYVLHISVV